MAAFEHRTLEIRRDDDTYEVAAHAVTEDFFQTLGVGASRGRALGASDRTTIDGTIAAVVSAGLERRLFPGGAAGQRLRVREAAGGEWTLTIVGVMPPGFERWHTPADLWLPLDAPGIAAADVLADVNRRTLTIVARLNADATLEQASAEMTALDRALDAETNSVIPDTGTVSSGARSGERTVTLVSPRDAQVSPEMRRSLWLLLLTASLVLIAALANSAGILHANTLERRTELSVRRALGATSLGLARQLIVESLIAIGLSAAAGGMLAWWSLAVLARAGGGEIAGQTIHLDAPILLFAAAIVLACGAGIGGVVMARASDGPLFERVPNQSGRLAATRLWTLLVAVQVAVCVAIGGIGGAALDAFSRLLRTDLGVDRQGVALVTFQFRDDDAVMLSDRRQRTALLDQLEARAARLAGATAAGIGSRAPLAGRMAAAPVITPEGHAFERREQMPVHVAVTPAFFRALALQPARGRLFDEHDGRGSAVIVSDTFARQYWPGENPLGKRVAVGRPRAGAPWLEVVGVVRDVRYENLHEPIRPVIYSPLERSFRNPLTLIARTTSDPAQALGTLRREVIAARPALRIVSTETLDGVVGHHLGQERYQAWLLLAFSGLAWVLATTAAAALALYSVVQRRREFAIRAALGARRSVIVRLASAMAARGAATGILAGLALTVAIDPIVAGAVPGLHTTFNRLPLIAVTALVATTVLLASYLPALLRHRGDPASVLRGE